MEWKPSKIAFVCLALALAACCGEDNGGGGETEPGGEKPQSTAPDFGGMTCSAKLQVSENACAGFASVCTRTAHLEGWCCIDNSQCGEPTDFR